MGVLVNGGMRWGGEGKYPGTGKRLKHAYVGTYELHNEYTYLGRIVE